MTSALISIKNLSREFPGDGITLKALDNISLDIYEGDYVSIKGPSGSGKSTLLSILGLLDKPTGGVYRLSGRDVTTLSDDEQATIRSENIGFVFQFFHLVPRLNAAENVELPMMLAGIPPAERRPRVEDALAGMDLTDRAHHRPDQLSGGQRQRVAIARATVMRPGVLLADEPTGNLDSKSGEEVVQILEKLNDDGITLIVVTHDPDIGGRAQRQLRMVDGRIEKDTRRKR